MGGTFAVDTHLKREAAGSLAVRNQADTGYGLFRAAGATADWLQLGTSFSDGSVEGRLQWNAVDGTLEFGLPGGNVTLQVGQEQLLFCKNTSGIGLTNGNAVYISGAIGDRPTIALADASSTDPNVHAPVGILTETVANNAWGYVNLGGLVRDVDTSAISEGGTVYLSDTEPGGYRATPPAPPNATAVLGWCIKQNVNSGIIMSHINSHQTLLDLNDVEHAAPSDGQLLTWDTAGGEWVLDDVSVYDVLSSEPANPAAGTVRLYIYDNTGTLELKAIQSDGTKDVIATLT